MTRSSEHGRHRADGLAGAGFDVAPVDAEPRPGARRRRSRRLRAADVSEARSGWRADVALGVRGAQPDHGARRRRAERRPWPGLAIVDVEPSMQVTQRATRRARR